MFRKHKRWKEPDIEPAPDLNGLESTLYPQASSSEKSLSSKCLVKTFSLDSSDIHHSCMSNDDLERNKKSENGDISKNGARRQNSQDNKNLSMSHQQEQGAAITSNYPDCIENDQESKSDVGADDTIKTPDKLIDKTGSVFICKGDIDKFYQECLESSKKCQNKRKDSGRLNFLERATRRLSLSTSRIKKLPEMFESRHDRFPQVLRPSLSLYTVDPLPEQDRPEVPPRPSRRFSSILKPSRSLNFRLNPTTNFRLDFKYEGSAKRNNHRVESFAPNNGCKERMSLEWNKRFPDLEKDSEWPNVTEVCYEERGSDGESQPASGASEESCTPVTVVKRDNGTRNQHDISKRLSLPADMRVPYSFLRKQSVSPTLDGPITRTVRRQSLSEIGFGRLNSYIKYEKLGEGSYATVYRGKSVLTNNQVALKVIRLEHEEGAPCTAIREISLLKNLKHHNIVTLHDIIHTDKVLTLVFEYLNNDLKSYLDANYNDMTKKHVQIFLFQLLRGLAYCHKRKVLHRDLKPQNILLNSKGELKLADFGLARAQSVPSKTYSNEVVTLWYRPPDVLLGSKDYSTSIDMWGVGCIFFEMLMNEALFPGHKASYQIEIIFNLLGEPTEETWPGCSEIQKVQELRRSRKFAEKWIPELKAVSSYIVSGQDFTDYPLNACFKKLGSVGSDLLKQLLKYDTKARISASDAMKHPYFANLGPEVHSLPDTASIFSAPGISPFKL